MKNPRAGWTVALGVALALVLAAGLASDRVGTALVAVGTLALAGVTFKTTVDADEQRQFERNPNISLKDAYVVYTQDDDFGRSSADLVLQMVANLGLHPILLRYVSLHDDDGARVLDAWIAPVPVASGEAKTALRCGLSTADQDRPVDLYDEVPARVMEVGQAVRYATWLRLVIQSGGLPGSDVHVWLPNYAARDSGEPIFDHTDVDTKVVPAPRQRRQST